MTTVTVHMKGKMKGAILAAAFLCCAAAFASAQTADQVPLRGVVDTGANMKYFNSRIYKIKDYKDSYVISYSKQTFGASTLVISKDWYRQNPQKLKFRRASGVIFPYMTVFYVEGEFNHIKLTLPLSRSNPVWGFIPSNNPNVPDPVPDNFPDFKF